MSWQPYMSLALAEAARAVGHSDVPVGAVVVDENSDVVATARNLREASGDPTAHAEIVALREAAKARRLGWRLDGCTMVVTLEPCLMCAGALLAARVDRLVFGAWDAKAGACGSIWDVVRDGAALHQIEVIPGVDASRSERLLANFFTSRRNTNPKARA